MEGCPGIEASYVQCPLRVVDEWLAIPGQELRRNLRETGRFGSRQMLHNYGIIRLRMKFYASIRLALSGNSATTVILFGAMAVGIRRWWKHVLTAVWQS